MERSGRYVPQHSELHEDYLSDDELSDDFTTGDISETSEIEDLYKTAVTAFKKQKYAAAKKLFERDGVTFLRLRNSRSVLPG